MTQAGAREAKAEQNVWLRPTLVSYGFTTSPMQYVHFVKQANSANPAEEPGVASVLHSEQQLWNRFLSFACYFCMERPLKISSRLRQWLLAISRAPCEGSS